MKRRKFFSLDFFVNSQERGKSILIQRPDKSKNIFQEAKNFCRLEEISFILFEMVFCIKFFSFINFEFISSLKITFGNHSQNKYKFIYSRWY